MEGDRPPRYPELARRRGEQGRVMLRVSVSADGKPIEVGVAQSSGHETLDQAAVTAVKQWRFVPASQGGRPVAAVAEVPVTFRLQD
jgi:protein TonB